MRFRLSFILCFVSLLVVTGGVVASGANRALWLSGSEPVLAELSSLASDQEPLSKSIDCEPMVVYEVSTCAHKTPFGTVANSVLLDGPKGAFQYDSSTGGSVMPSVPNRPNMLITEVSPRNWTYGTSIRIGTYDPAALQYKETYGLPTKKNYQYTGPVGTVLKAADGTILNFGSGDVAYSSNGKWMVALLYGGGLMRYDLDTLQGKVLAWDVQSYSTSSGHTKTNNLAASDDGRFVAVTQSVPATNGTRPSLRVYDAESCRDQYANKTGVQNACEFKDMWTGEYRTGNSRGLRDMLPSAEYPRRVRFVANNSLTFDSIHDRTGAATYSVSRYSVSVETSESREYVGLLGMGDSYISGEGASGTYFEGTDTKQNKCHLSWFSYPYRIGAKQFSYGRSVACSGAKMLDITVAAGDPEGLIDGEKVEENYVGQVKNEEHWYDRDRSNIIKYFSPGYANQVIFAREYKPRAILLSVGGNDVGFTKVVTSCAGFAGACYQYYEDRVQLMETILGQYDRLVQTYKDVRNSSGARVYVMAYPQVAKAGGNCGVNVRLDAQEVQFSAQLITYLNSVIKRAAAEAGVYYVDTENALAGHRLCEASGSEIAVNGLTAGDDKQVKGYVYTNGTWRPVSAGLGNESYHPNSYGHNLMGQTIVAKTSNLTVAMPTAVPNNKPALDKNATLLKNIPHVPEQQRHTEAIRWADTADMPAILLKQEEYATQIKPGSLAAGSQVDIIVHSDPVVLYSGTYTEGMQLRFVLPDSLEPGFHTLDIYGTAPDGTQVDIRQILYVAASAGDYDGDGAPNDVDDCSIVQQSGLDADADGVDDACDGQIASQSGIVPEQAPDLPASSPLNLDSTEEVDFYEGGLVRPYIEPTPEDEVTDGAEDATKPESDNHNEAAPSVGGNTASAVTVQSKTMNVALLAQGKLQAYFGYALTPDDETRSDDSNVRSNQPSFVLGKTAKANASSSTDLLHNDKEQTNVSLRYIASALVVVAAIMIGVVRYRHKRA